MTGVERRLDMLTSAEVAAIDKALAVVVWPIGSIEQHGPHLPCGTDIILANAITERAIEMSDPAVSLWLLPPQAFGKSTEHDGFAGTMTLSTTTLLAVIHDIAAAVAASGFTRLVFVNGHGGQPHLLEVAARDVRAATGLMVFPVFPYRIGFPEGVTTSIDELTHGIHGGELETSMMLAVAPETVRTDRFAPGGDRRRELFGHLRHLSLEGDIPAAWLTADISASGVIGDSTHASADRGVVALEHLASGLAGALAEISRFTF